MVASVLPLKSLDAVTSTGAGSVLDLGGIANTFQVVVSGTGFATSNPFSSYTVELQGSLDGTIWYSLGTTQTASTGDSRLGLTTSGYLARYIRANLVQLVPGGGSPVITAFIAVGGD